MTRPIWPPNPFMPSKWEDYRAYDPKIVEAYYQQAAKNWKYGILSWPRQAGKNTLKKRLEYFDRIETALEKLHNLADGFHHADLRMQLWSHFNQREHRNLQALTHKWIKEHQ